jgi:hypothetical protein
MELLEPMFGFRSVRRGAVDCIEKVLVPLGHNEKCVGYNNKRASFKTTVQGVV